MSSSRWQRRVSLIALVVIVCGVTSHAQMPTSAPSLSDTERAWLDALNVRANYASLLVKDTERLALLGETLERLGKELKSTADELGTLRARLSSAQLTQEEADLKAKIEARHPGYTWDPKTGMFTKKDKG